MNSFIESPPCVPFNSFLFNLQINFELELDIEGRNGWF